MRACMVLRFMHGLAIHACMVLRFMHGLAIIHAWSCDLFYYIFSQAGTLSLTAELNSEVVLSGFGINESQTT